MAPNTLASAGRDLETLVRGIFTKHKVKNPVFELKHDRDPAGRFTATRGDTAAPELLQARREFGERLKAAGTRELALAAVPAKFSYDLEDGATSYRNKGRLVAPSGAGSAVALEAYQSTDDYLLLNRFMRGLIDGQKAPGHKGGLSTGTLAHVQDRIAYIDKTMAVSRLDHDVVVYRVVPSGAELFGKWWAAGEDIAAGDFAKLHEVLERRKAGWRPNASGMRFTDHGFVSTSARDEWPKKWASQWDPSGDEPLMMRMLVPKGTGAVQLSDSGEMEILLERGLAFEVVEDHGVGADGLHHLDIRVVT